MRSREKDGGVEDLHRSVGQWLNKTLENYTGDLLTKLNTTNRDLQHSDG